MQTPPGPGAHCLESAGTLRPLQPRRYIRRGGCYFSCSIRYLLHVAQFTGSLGS
jgi:hypothetical protein